MNTRKIYKDSVVYFMGSIIVAILGFIVSLLYSYFFNPNEYGVHSLASSTYMLFSQFFGLWLSTGVLRFHEKYKNEQNTIKFYSSLFLLQLFISIIFVILLNIGSFIISDDKLFSEIFLIYTFVYFFEYNLLIFNSYLRCEGKSESYNANIMINNFLKIVILLLLMFIFKIKSIVVISISILLTECLQYIYFMFKFKLYKFYRIENFRPEIAKSVFIYAFPLIGTTITSWILNVSDRYVIRLLKNSYDVGLYSYAYLLGNNLFWLLSNFIMLGAYPNFVKLYEKNQFEELQEVMKKYINLYLLIIIPCCFGALAISKILFMTITSEMYHESYMVFVYTGIGISILGLCQFTNKIFELFKKTKVILMLNIICAIFNIIFNFIFISCFGYVGGAISTMLSYLLYFILSIIMSKKYIEIKWDYKMIFKCYFSATIMMLLIILMQNIINIQNSALILILSICTGVVSYFMILFLIGGLNKTMLNNIIRTVYHK